MIELQALGFCAENAEPWLTSIPVVTAPLAPRDRYVSLFTELSLQVRAAGLLRRRRGYYLVLMAVTITVFVGLWLGVAALGDSWWQLLVAAGFGVLSAQFGYLGHDGAHRQIFASAAANAWSARLLSALFAGLSYGWWSGKHNKHHNAPNQEDRDPDIRAGVVAFTPAIAASRTGAAAWFTRHQGWAFFPLLTLEGVALHLGSVQTLIRERTMPYRRLELTLIAARLTGFAGVLFILLPPGKAVAFMGVQLAVFGVSLGASFAPNHKGMPLVPATMKVDFLRRQVIMSRNIRGGPVLDFLMGGLNYQIEHHLFPNMPRPNLKLAQPLVRAHCAAHAIAYTETSLINSYAIVVRYLNRVGLSERDPFTCPLVQQYRA